MATYTSKLNLVKPEINDLVSPTVFADNFDKIDAAYAGLSSDLATTDSNLEKLNNSLSIEDYSSSITVSDEITLHYAIKTGKKVEIGFTILAGVTFPTGYKKVIDVPDLAETKPHFAILSPNGYKDIGTLGVRILSKSTGVQIFGNNVTNLGSVYAYVTWYVN